MRELSLFKEKEIEHHIAIAKEHEYTGQYQEFLKWAWDKDYSVGTTDRNGDLVFERKRNEYFTFTDIYEAFLNWKEEQHG